MRGNSPAAAAAAADRFPTLKFFRGGKASEYEGGRTASDIVKFVVKKSGPAYQTVATEEEATKFAEANEVAVLGVFSDLDSDEAKAFIETAKGNDDGAVAAAAVERGTVAASPHHHLPRAPQCRSRSPPPTRWPRPTT